MKSLKAAAVLAGSLIAAAGAATPASAHNAPDLAPTGHSAPDVAATDLSGAVNTRLPLSQSAMLGSKDSVVRAAKEAATVVNDAKPVHGNLYL
ncbi:hypothetical protein [Streptomyces griseus]|uniref:hypothetical protein n=1 Tax=Streptomyces griseus TaxID=1911 RepID=UPI00055D2C5B|nr:hypothetical protein [Streptomyces griseus]